MQTGSKLITLLLLICFSLSVNGQINPCGFDQLIKKDSAFIEKIQQEDQKYIEWRKNNPNSRLKYSTPNYTTPNKKETPYLEKSIPEGNQLPPKLQAINPCSGICGYNNTYVVFGNAPSTINSILTAPNIYGGEFIRVNNMVAGNTYKIYTCGQSDFDTQLSLYTMGGVQCIDFNDDACGTQSEIYFTPTTSGSYDILLDEYNCQSTFIVNTDVFVKLIYVNGTCGYNNNIYLTVGAPTVLNQIVPFTQTWGGDYNRIINMIAGNTYRIYTCGSTSFDSQLSVFTAGGGQAVAFNDDACGLQSEIYFTPSTTGNYDILLDAYPCENNSIDMTVNVQLVYIQRPVITIPVVVHVLYNNSTENISTAQIQSQINVLNQDFLMQNSGLSNVPAPFRGVASNPLIQFCLAQQDPNGNPTTGIERINTTKQDFCYSSSGGFDTSVFYTLLGGADPWNKNEYLNIWVCDFMGTPMVNNSGLGFPKLASFPPFYQGIGVILDHRAFGTTGTVLIPQFQYGKNTVHEIGHWLGLWHMWAGFTPATDCESDSIADTPFASADVNGLPLDYTIFDMCTNTYPGLMYFNYMDYPHDLVRNMFTYEQIAKFDYALFNWYLPLLTSTRCNPSTVNIAEIELKNSVSVFPNPTSGLFTIQFLETGKYSFEIMNQLGQIIYQSNITDKQTEINLSNQSNGIYFIQIKSESGNITKKLIVNK